MPLNLSMVLAIASVQLFPLDNFPSPRLKKSGLDQLFIYNSHRCGNIPNANFPFFHKALQNYINFRPKMIGQRITNDVWTANLSIAEIDITSILQGLDLVF